MHHHQVRMRAPEAGGLQLSCLMRKKTAPVRHVGAEVPLVQEETSRGKGDYAGSGHNAYIGRRLASIPLAELRYLEREARSILCESLFRRLL